MMDRVVIAHEHHGRFIVARSETAHHVEHLTKLDARLQGPLTGDLNGRTVGHRIGEGHAELDDIRARLGQPCKDLETGLGVGIARHDIGHEARAAFTRKICEAAFDSTGWQ